MSKVTDYKLVVGKLGGDDVVQKDFDTFIQSVSSNLKNGYTLHGAAKGKFASYGHVSQAMVECDKPTGETIIDYSVIVCSSGSYDVNKDKMIVFEKNISDMLRKGWSLYGETQYTYDSQDNWNKHLHSQTLVKYKKPEVTLDML